MKFSQDGVRKENKHGNLCFCEIFESGELHWNQRNTQKGGVSCATVYRCLKREKKHRKPKKCPRQLKLIDTQTQRLMARKIKFLRLEGGFSSKRLVKECSIELSISTSTVTQTLRRMGYHYLQVWNKGILTEEDKTASFAHKYNPCDH